MLRSRIGILFLKSAVVSVMKKNCGLINPKQISDKSGIYRGRGKDDFLNDAITAGILNILREDGKVDYIPPTRKNARDGGWRLK